MSQEPMGLLLGLALNWREENRRQLQRNYIRCEIDTQGTLLLVRFEGTPLGSTHTRTETFKWRGPLAQYPRGVHVYTNLSNFMNRFAGGLRYGTIKDKGQ